MIIYFKSEYTPPSDVQTIVLPKPLNVFQIWYGRTNYWMNDISTIDSEIIACNKSGVSGYMISLDPWNGSFDMSKIEDIANEFEHLLKLCQSLGMWLVVSVGNGSTNGYNLDNLRYLPKAALQDKSGYGKTVMLDLTFSNALGNKLGQSIVGISTNEDLDSDYLNPEIIISPSPTEDNCEITLTSSKFDGKDVKRVNLTEDFTITNPGSGYNIYLNNLFNEDSSDDSSDESELIFPYYSNLLSAIKSKIDTGLNLSNLVIQPISNMNDDELSTTKLINLIINNLNPSNIVYNGNNGNPDKVNILPPYTIQAFHPSSITETSNLFMGNIVVSTPVKESSVYNDILEDKINFSPVSAYSPYFINMINTDSSSTTKLTRVFNKDLLPYILYKGMYNNSDFYIVEIGNIFRVCQLIDNKFVCIPGNITNYSTVYCKKFVTPPPASSLTNYYIYQYRDSNLYEFRTNDSSSIPGSPPYAESTSSADIYSFELEKTRDKIANIYVSSDYSDVNNETSTNNLSLWIAKCKSAGATVVGYDSFYRKTPERRIFSTLNPDNY